MKIQGVIFDMDGTLVDSLAFWDCFWKDMGKKYFGDPDFRMDPVHFDTHVRTMIFGRAISYIHGYLKIPCPPEEFDAFAADYVHHFYTTVATAKPGAIELESCGLAEFFTPETIISCSDIGVGKERPDVFLAACKVLGTPLSETAVFEDSALALETARRAGFVTVGVYDSHHSSAERLAAAADLYLGEGTTLADALPHMEV